ncbi:MAG: Uma2 family endonuclease [Myxococcaceae bacterium]|nr:Uma2 family endonuclease [Myxococcaceae bacterium]
MGQTARQRIAFDEYVRMEAMSPLRHEWLDGAVWAMAGGTPDHAAIAVNVTTQLATQLRGKRCRVFGADLRVRVRATGLGTYPDASVVCGALQYDPDDVSKTTAVNPKVIVEVLSPSTEDYDRGEKLEHYKKLPTLEEIVLVAHDERRIEVWRREGRRWRRHDFTAGVAELHSLKCELSVAEVYRNPLED